MKKIVREEGVQGLWRGLQASLVLCVNPAITYGMFERLKTIALRRSGDPNGRLTPGQTFVIGALSKALATVVTCESSAGEQLHTRVCEITFRSLDPYIMAKVRMQWKPPKDVGTLSEKEKDAITYKSSWDILQKVLMREGVAGWYNVSDQRPLL